MDSYSYIKPTEGQKFPRRALINAIQDLAGECPKFGCGAQEQDLGGDWRAQEIKANKALADYLRARLDGNLDILEEFAFMKIGRKPCPFDLEPGKEGLDGSAPFSSTMAHKRGWLKSFGIEDPDSFVGATTKKPHAKRMVGLMKLLGAIHYINSGVTETQIKGASWTVRVKQIYKKGPKQGQVKLNKQGQEIFKDVKCDLITEGRDPRIMSSYWTRACAGDGGEDEVVQVVIKETKERRYDLVEQVMKIAKIMDDEDKRELIDLLQEQLGVVRDDVSPEVADDVSDTTEAFPDDVSADEEEPAQEEEVVWQEPAEEDLELSDEDDEDQDETDEETLVRAEESLRAEAQEEEEEEPAPPQLLNEFGGTELIGEKYRGTNWTITEIGTDGFPMTLEQPAPFAKTLVKVDEDTHVWEEEDMEEMYDKDLKYLGQLD